MTKVPSISKNNLTLKENLSWTDIQGLSWMLEEPDLKFEEKFSAYACA